MEIKNCNITVKQGRRFITGGHVDDFEQAKMLASVIKRAFPDTKVEIEITFDDGDTAMYITKKQKEEN